VQPAAPYEILTKQVRLDTEFSMMNILSYQSNLTQICLQSMSRTSAIHLLMNALNCIGQITELSKALS